MYDLWYDTPLGSYVWYVEKAAITKMLPRKIDGVAIDVGAGTGMSLETLLDQDVQLVGVDISWQMLKIAQEKLKAHLNTSLIIADAENLPFRNSIAELMLGITTLEFVPNPMKSLYEMRRVLQTRGWLVLGILPRTSLWTLERRLRNIVRPDVFTHAKFPSPWQLIRMLRQASFADVQYRGSVYALTFTPTIFLPGLTHLDAKWGAQWLLRSFGAFLVFRARNATYS